MRNRKLVIFMVFLLIWAVAGSMAYGSDVRIGLIYSKDEARQYRAGEDQRKNYRDAIEANGAMVVELFFGEEPQATADKVDEIDGLLIPGGIDIDPKFYKEDRHEKLEDTDEKFDKYEMWILERAVEREIPVLGICRGHQLINVFFGGSMYQDIPSLYESDVKVAHRTKKDGKTALTMHEVKVEKESIFFRLMKKERILVNSFHHQGVKDLAEGFRVTARSDDGFVEAMECASGRAILGVQFHPEKMRREKPEFDAFFKWLVDEAGKARTARKEKEKEGEKVPVLQ